MANGRPHKPRLDLRDDGDPLPPMEVPELPVVLVRLTDRTAYDGQDPRKINLRLYRQMDILLAQLEDPNSHISAYERARSIAIIGRIQVMFIALRKEGKGEDDNRAGSAVRKYAEAFADAPRGRKKRSRGRLDPSEDSELAGLIGDGDGEDDFAEQ